MECEHDATRYKDTQAATAPWSPASNDLMPTHGKDHAMMKLLMLHRCKTCAKVWFPRKPETPDICPTCDATLVPCALPAPAPSAASVPVEAAQSDIQIEVKILDLD